MLVWDIDDTLYDRADPIAEACEEVTGHAVPDKREFYRRFQVHSDAVFDQVERGELSLEESRRIRISRTMEELGRPISSREAEAFQKLYGEKQRQIRLAPAMEEILSWCAGEGIPMGVLTNGPAGHQREKVRALGLSRWIPKERVCVSEELGVAKPLPEAFHLAEERLSCAPERLWMVGDSLKSDILGALAAGWRAIWFSPFRTMGEATPKGVLCAGDYGELFSVLKDIKGEIR